jgi:hypothetical protein
MRKSIYMLVFVLLWFSGALNGHYVYISLYNAPEGYLSNSEEIVPRSFGPVIRVTDAYRLYCFQIHEDTGTLILFAPDNNWEAVAHELRDQSAFERHRDEHVLERFENMPEYDGTWRSHEKRSKFIADAFVTFFDKLAKLHPDSEFGLSFRGHGSGGGELMEYRILPDDAFDMLKSWNRSLGRKLLSIDMSWPCKKGSFSDLVNFSPFTKYYLATDLNNGGYTMDEWTHEKYKECNPPIWLELGDGKPYLDYVGEELQRERQNYEYSRRNMIKDKVMQSRTCFDSEKFLRFADAFQSVWVSDEKRGSVDVKEYLETQVEDNERLLQLFNDCIVGTVNNKDFFEWSREANGMYKFNAGSKTYRLVVDEVEGGVIESFPKSEVYLEGSGVDLIATPREGYVFEGWSGDARGLGHEVLLKVDGDLFVSASFSPVLPDDSAFGEETAEDEETPAANKDFTLSAESGDDAFADISLDSTEVDRNAPAGTVVGNFSTADPIADAWHRFGLPGGIGFPDNSHFRINGKQLVTHSVFDSQGKDTFVIRVQLKGAAGKVLEKTFRIRVKKENRPPDFTPEGSPDDYRKKWEAAMDRIGKLEDALLDANTTINSLKDQIAKLKGELATKDDIIAELKGENDQWQAWGESMEEENAALKESLAEAERILLISFTPDWFFIDGMGWLWTSPECYPWIYSAQAEGWLFYELGTSDPWRYFDYNAETWLTVPIK